MKRTSYVKLITLVLICIIISNSTPLWAYDSLSTEDQTLDRYVKSILSGEMEFSELPVGTVLPMVNMDTVASYYIVTRDFGYLITRQGNTLIDTTYTAGNISQQWSFTHISGTTDTYAIRPVSNPNLAITVYPDTYSYGYCDVNLENFNSANTNQHWRVIIDGGKVFMVSQSSNGVANGMRLSSSLQASNTDYAPLNFIKVSDFVPCTSISFSPSYVNVPIDAISNLPSMTYSPSNATHMASPWLEMLTNDVCSLDADKRQIKGKKIGTRTVTIRHKIIKNVSCTISVTTQPPTIIIKYDNAFAAVAQNNFNSTPAALINSYISTAMGVYYDRFNLQLTYVANTSPTSSYPETAGASCCGSNHNSFCTQTFTGTDCYDVHHKNYHKTINELYQNIFYTINLYFSGQRNCGEYEDPKTNEIEHKEDRVVGVANFPYTDAIGDKAVVFVNPNNSNNDEFYMIVKTLVHEMGHNFSVQDHYDVNYDNTPDESGRSNACIWGQDRNQAYVYENLTMCNYCTGVLEDYIDDLYA